MGRQAADDVESPDRPHAHDDISPQSGSLPIWTERARRLSRSSMNNSAASGVFQHAQLTVALRLVSDTAALRKTANQDTVRNPGRLKHS